MTTTPEPAETAVVSAIPGIDMDALLSGVAQAAPASPLEQALANVDPADARATSLAQTHIQFRSMLSEQQLAALKAGAPALADKMTSDLNAIIAFGGPVLQKMNDASTALLNAQRDIKLPEADQIVNDLLREMDGFEKRFRIAKLEDGISKVKSFLHGVKYTLSAMVRESKPLVDKLDMAEVKVADMENKLGDNIARGQLLHKQTLEHLDQVVAVLAALEEVIDVVRAEFAEADTVLTSAQKAAADGVSVVEWKGQRISVNEMSEIHANLSTALSEIEKTWFDWRQQFFMGYAHAPATRNLVVSQFSLRRRLQTFRTMGIPSARHSLVLWQQAALAKEGAEMGQAVQDGVNKMIQRSFQDTAEAVGKVAEAAQAPVITEETVFTVIDSIKQQCAAIVAADAAGRALREKNVRALEAGEVVIRDEFEDTQRKLAQARLGGQVAPGAAAPAIA